MACSLQLGVYQSSYRQTVKPTVEVRLAALQLLGLNSLLPCDRGCYIFKWLTMAVYKYHK
jgi:hypothetical protein